MHVLVVFDHAYGAEAGDDVPHHRSLSAALLRQVLAGLADARHTHDLLDLAAEGFQPVMSAAELRGRRLQEPPPSDVASLQTRLAAPDHLVLVFPTWWMSMPTGTKGFLDRVLTPGFAYDEPRPGRPLVRRLTRLQGVSVLSPMTSPEWAYRWWFGQPAARILGRGTFRLIGIRRVRWYAVPRSVARGAAGRDRELARVRRRFGRLRPRTGALRERP